MLLLAALIGMTQCARQEAAIRLKPVTWGKLPGWGKEDFGKALSAFQATCQVLQKRQAWQETCSAAHETDPRLFFESHFQPYTILSPAKKKGLATGYYVPILKGSFFFSETYRYPLYEKPASLIEVNLRDFGMPPQTLKGRIDGQRLVPYWRRQAIDSNPGLLAGAELLWLSDPFSAFIASVQGSALVRLSDDSLIRVYYAADNGHAYHSIGNDLVKRGELPKGQASLFAIRDWLKNHPERQQEILAQNPRYIFFKASLDTTVKGALGVPLTPKYSVAVDPRFIPLGAPLYLQAEPTVTHPAMTQLVFAQDVGSAIKGEKRIDFYWGVGEEAERQASAMKSPIELWLLLPKSWDKKTILAALKHEGP